MDLGKLSISFQSFLMILYSCIVFHYRCSMIYLNNPLLMKHTQEISAHNLCEPKQKPFCFQYSPKPLFNYLEEGVSLPPVFYPIILPQPQCYCPLECNNNGWIKRILRTHRLQPWRAYFLVA